MYRNFRGALNFRFTITLASSVSGAIGGVYATNESTFAYLNYLPTNSIPASGTQGDAPYAFAGAYDPANIGIQPWNSPASVRLSQKQAAEFQIPFLSVYPTNLLLADEDVESYDGQLFPDGRILFYIMGTDFQDGNQTINIDCWGCFADEAHMGTFYGTPTVQGIIVNGNSIYPSVNQA